MIFWISVFKVLRAVLSGLIFDQVKEWDVFCYSTFI